MPSASSSGDNNNKKRQKIMALHGEDKTQAKTRLRSTSLVTEIELISKDEKQGSLSRHAGGEWKLINSEALALRV